METLMKADIFFFITSIFVVIMMVVFLVASVYLIKIIINFYKISSILRKAALNAETGLKELSDHVRESPLFTFIFGKRKIKEEVKVVHKKTI